MKRIHAAIAFSALVLTAPAIGEPAGQPGLAAASPVSIERCAPGTGASVSESEHARLLGNALDDFGRSGFPSLRNHIPKLRRALDSAPACYPKIEQRDAVTIVRALSDDEYLRLSSLISATQPSGSGSTTSESIAMQGNTYGTISLLLGSAAVEDRQYMDALTLLERGLALQPRNEMLLTEKVAALQGLGRNADALAVLDFILNDGELGATADRSRILRLKGVVLIDLERLDEAEAALNDSIKLNPNDPVARNELTYIAQLRANGPRRQLEITAPNAPRPN